MAGKSITPLPQGTILHGEKSDYIVGSIICSSERSVTFSAASAGGNTFRLKLYSSSAYVTEETQRRIFDSKIKYVLSPEDIGEYMGARFYVFREIKAQSADSIALTAQTLQSVIIPQLAYVMYSFHKNKILIRDICPEHILYDPAAKKILFIGLNNAALLKGEAASTKSEDFGQRLSFIAPEAGEDGSSFASDSFSLGITILSLLTGRDPAENMSREEFIKMLQVGKLPGIDTNHLKNTPYELYSTEDKIFYLVLGLTLFDRSSRWGIGEIRVWRSGHNIPLVRKEGRIAYQYAAPISIGKTVCWNNRQLALALAADKDGWTDERLSKFIPAFRERKVAILPEVESIINDTSLSAEGKRFRIVYTLDPKLDGFYFRSRKYADSAELAGSSMSEREKENLISEMLRNGCFSFFERTRAAAGKKPQADIRAVEELERAERIYPGTNASKCVMLFTAKKKFRIGGREYENTDSLIDEYKNNGNILRDNSLSILKEKSFIAWMWAEGMGKAAEDAALDAEKEPSRAFYYFLALCEKAAGGDGAKQTIRKLFLRFGGYAPVVWLTENIDSYKLCSETRRELYNSLSKAKFSLSEPLSALNSKASGLVGSYQSFVSSTCNNPLMIGNEGLKNGAFSFYPLYTDGFFCLRHSSGLNLEVCPAFVYSVNETPDENEIDAWLKRCSGEEELSLSESRSEIDLLVFPEEGTPDEYMDNCAGNIIACIAAVITAVIMFFISVIKFPAVLHLISSAMSIVFSLVYPLCAWVFYRKKIAVAGLWKNNNQAPEKAYAEISEKISGLSAEASEIRAGIMNKRKISVNVGNIDIPANSYSPQSPGPVINDGAGLIFAEVLSSVGFVFLGLSIYCLLGNAGIFGMFYALAYSFIVPAALRKTYVYRSAGGWALDTGIPVLIELIGCAVFGRGFMIFMLIFAVAVVLIAIGAGAK